MRIDKYFDLSFLIKNTLKNQECFIFISNYFKLKKDSLPKYFALAHNSSSIRSN